MVTKGDNYTWRDEVAVQVTRVAKDGSWADLYCEVMGNIGGGWAKRMPLPLPEEFIFHSHSEA